MSKNERNGGEGYVA